MDAHRVCARSFLGGAPLRRSPFGRCESLECGSHYAGGGGGGGRKKGVGGTINKLYCGRYVEQISAKRAGPVGYVYILTHLFSASSSYLYLFLRHVPSHHVRTTTATATFRPPTLHRRSMHVHHFFSFRPPRPILLLLPCPCTYIYFHCFFFFFFTTTTYARMHSQITWVSPLCEDEHYKYLVPLLIPVTTWFAIANWVGWEYFRFA